MTHDSPITARPSARADEATARHADALLRDTRFDWLRPRARRRALVLAAIAWLALVALACLRDNALVVLRVLAPAWLLWWVFQRVVRGMADLPDRYVDERMRSVRNAHYRTAYLLFAGLSIAGYLAMYMAADAGRVAWRPEARHLHALFWVMQLTAMMLPSWVVAWKEEYL